jgi:hypothetical protein
MAASTLFALHADLLSSATEAELGALFYNAKDDQSELKGRGSRIRKSVPPTVILKRPDRIPQVCRQHQGSRICLLPGLYRRLP